MTTEEYFGDWLKVIPINYLNEVVKQLNILYKSNNVTPEYSLIFRAFTMFPLRDLKAVFLSQDPYPQKGVSTGLAFANNKEPISPSLEVLKNACITTDAPVEFDITLEHWAKQGILLLNSALTCEIGKPNSHTMLWRKFIAKLINALNYQETGILYVLFGEQAKTFLPYINTQFNDVIISKHPAYYARMNEDMPSSLFININKIIEGKYGKPFKWYKEL